MLNNEVAQSSKFGIKKWVEIHDNVLQKFKTTMLESCLCDYRDAYILAKLIITVAEHEAHATAIAGDTNSK